MRMVEQAGLAEESGEYAGDGGIMADVQGKNANDKPFPVNVK